jgi:acyl-CoA hydrolase
MDILVHNLAVSQRGQPKPVPVLQREDHPRRIAANAKYRPQVKSANVVTSGKLRLYVKNRSFAMNTVFR